MTAVPALTNGELDAFYDAPPTLAIVPYRHQPRLVNRKQTVTPAVIYLPKSAGKVDPKTRAKGDAVIIGDGGAFLIPAEHEGEFEQAMRSAFPSRNGVGYPAPTVVLDLTTKPTPFDAPIGVLCDQPQPLVKLISCWPRHLEAGDVLYTNLQRPNGLPYSRRYTLVSIERVTERDCEAVIEWQDTHERQTRRFFEGLTLEQLVDGSKFTRARKDMRWVKAANGALGSWTWRGEKRK